MYELLYVAIVALALAAIYKRYTGQKYTRYKLAVQFSSTLVSIIEFKYKAKYNRNIDLLVADIESVFNHNNDKTVLYYQAHRDEEPLIKVGKGVTPRSLGLYLFCDGMPITIKQFNENQAEVKIFGEKIEDVTVCTAQEHEIW